MSAAPVTNIAGLRTAKSKPRGSRTLPRNQILVGDALEKLRELPDASIDCVVTSPPYYRLRNYQTRGQIGMEPSVDDYVEALAEVFDEVARALKPTGSCWINVSDSFSRNISFGAEPKSLLLAPERLALKLVNSGWILRSKVIWAKPNPMPSPIRDRLSCTFEFVYHFVRSQKYFFDLDAIREPHKSAPGTLTKKPRRERAYVGPRKLKYEGEARPAWAGALAGTNCGLIKARAEGRVGHRLGKNPGDVWRISTANFAGAHFATFPQALIERPIKATCPAKVCESCGLAWQQSLGVAEKASCDCGPLSLRGIVLDPFIGAGTTALAAQSLGRDWLGIELNANYRKIAMARIDSGAQRARKAHAA